MGLPHPDPIAAIRALLPEIADGAADRDRDRVAPRAVLDHLSTAGVLAALVPVADGGPGHRLSIAVEITRLLATVDPNVAQIPQSHFVYLRLAALGGGPEVRAELAASVLAGGRIANAQSERGGRTITDLATRVRLDGDSAIVDGEKFYATGSVLADWIAVVAVDPDGAEQVGFLPVSTPGLEVVDDWNGMGQRTTASGTVRFAGARLPVTHLVERAPVVRGPFGYGAFAQALHAAIDVGLARGALDEAARQVQNSTRPWFEAEVDRAADDPLLVQRFGELEVQVRAAEALLEVAGRALDFADEQRDDGAAADASLAVAAAKVAGDRAALAAANGLFELAGTRSADERLNLHRHWRNARTHTLHDPVRWKVQHLGRWAVDGRRPPRGAQI